MEIKITYETLFDLLRKEKNREELQELQSTFYDDVVNYINEKKDISENQTKIDLFADQEKAKAELQLSNIKRILKELYDRREKKIINMALTKARTGSSIINTSALLEQEKALFDSLVNVLDSARQSILITALNAQKIEKKPSETAVEQPKELKREEEKQKKDLKKIKILDFVPKFVGLDLQIYGPFQEEDVVNLPNEIANILINNKKAEEIL